MAKKNFSAARGRVVIYARNVLGILEAEKFNNQQLCKLCGLSPFKEELSHKKAFYIISEFAFSDAVSIAVKKHAANKRAMRVAKSTKDKSFYQSREWLELRYKVLKAASGKCECCGASAASGVVLHVDHIKPRSKYPALAHEFSNMQVLCSDCNLGKSNKDQTDWRESEYSESAIDRILQSF